MSEYVELANWFGWRLPHEPLVVDSLPDPSFRVNDRVQVSFSTNNYLGIATHQRMRAAAIRGIEMHGVGNSDSRLLGGNLALYGELERKIARSSGKTHAILFATGYLANLGALATLPRATQVARALGFTTTRDYSYAYFSDEYNHISIREGMRLSGARRYSYRHLDLDHLEKLLSQSTATSRIIVTDGVFSQDGDIAPIPDLLRLAERWDCDALCRRCSRRGRARRLRRRRARALQGGQRTADLHGHVQQGLWFDRRLYRGAWAHHRDPADVMPGLWVQPRRCRRIRRW